MRNKILLIVLTPLLIGCMSQIEVMRHYQRGGVLPYGNNKKLMKYEKNYKWTCGKK